MYNYYSDLVWKIDQIFFYATLFLSLLIIIYTAIKEKLEDKRARTLIAIRNDLQGLALQGQEIFKESCPVLINKTTPYQLFDIARNREKIISEEIEPHLRECILASGKIAQIENAARKTKNKWRRIER